MAKTESWQLLGKLQVDKVLITLRWAGKRSVRARGWTDSDRRDVDNYLCSEINLENHARVSVPVKLRLWLWANCFDSDCFEGNLIIGVRLCRYVDETAQMCYTHTRLPQ